MPYNMNTIRQALTSLAVVIVALMLSSFGCVTVANEASIVGKWVLVTSEEYDESSVKQSTESADGIVWEFTDQKFIIHDKNDELDGIPLDYSFKERTLTVDKIAITYKAYELTDSKLVLRSSVIGGIYVIHTFKRMK